MSIRLRVLCGFILLSAAGVFSLSRFVSLDLWPFTQQTSEESLVETAAVLASFVESRSADGIAVADLRLAMDAARRRQLQALIYDIKKETVDLRVYLTDTNGIVLYDSDDGRDEGHDYSRWNDVRRVLEGRYGARATRSDARNPFTSVLYVGAPIRQDGRTVGVLSVGKPMRGLELVVWSMRQRVLWTGLALIAAAAVAGLALTFWITQPIARLTAYARGIGAGARAALPRLRTPELAALGEAMESMRVALEGKHYVEGYVRSLTHQIKAPLSAIRASAELLDEQMPIEDRRRFVRAVRAETERLQFLIDRMLELSALEARQRLERTESVDLHVEANEVIETVAPVAAQKGIAITSALSPQTIVPGDRFLIRQALLNLAQNAVSATPAGGTIRLSASADDEGIELAVEDSGPGVPDYALPRVFERFYSAPLPGREHSGTGLGLPFVREVAHLHGGEATLANLLTGGARATLRLRRGPASRGDARGSG